jgi:predicted methyltransferase
MHMRSRGCGLATLVAGLFLASSVPVFGLSSEASRIVEALGAREGMVLADVGAGGGEWTEELATAVGPRGHVYATEVDESKIREIADRARQNGLENVTTVRGTQLDSGLSAGCCDGVLLRMVYHHFTEPARMRESLRRALRRGARLVVIDTEPHPGWPPVAGVTDRGGHGIREEDLVREMASDGFEVVARREDWGGRGDRYCVVFRVASPQQEN